MPGKVSKHLFLGLILILMGILFLFNNLGYIDFSAILHQWWPLLLVLLGVYQLYLTRGDNCFAWFLLIAGLILQLIKAGILSFGVIRLYWPLFLILFGLLLLLQSSERKKTEPPVKENKVDFWVIFGGVERKLEAAHFQGGNLTAAFGGIELDLRAARLAGGRHVLNVHVLFGGIEIKVPEDWVVEINGIPILGAIEDSRKYIKPANEEEPRLKINALVAFGGLEIAN